MLLSWYDQLQASVVSWVNWSKHEVKNYIRITSLICHKDGREILQIRYTISNLTFNFTYWHLNTAFATFAHIILWIIVWNNAIVQHKPPWLPSCHKTKYYQTTKCIQNATSRLSEPEVCNITWQDGKFDIRHMSYITLTQHGPSESIEYFRKEAMQNAIQHKTTKLHTSAALCHIQTSWDRSCATCMDVWLQLKCLYIRMSIHSYLSYSLSICKARLPLFSKQKPQWKTL